MLLFTFVMLHETCHVIMAWVLKLKVAEIEFFPFGGVARIDNLDSSGPLKEVLVAIVGPLFNVAAASLIFFLNDMWINIPYYRLIISINIGLAFFNLLPGLPLDGGRILRAVLSYYVGFRKATRTAVVMGKVTAILILLYGTITALYETVNLSLLVVPVFIFVSASKEENNLMYTVIKDVVGKKAFIKDKGIMDAVNICAYESTYVREVLKHFDINKYNIVIIINNDMEIEGVLTESQIFDSLPACRASMTLGQLCRNLGG